MAEVTSGKNLTVVVLDEVEAAALTDLLYADSVDHENGTPALDNLYGAMLVALDDVHLGLGA